MKYSDRIVTAFALAHELHGRQVRKNSDIPYITHLMGVAEIVGLHGGGEEQFVAALLHDAVEDQGGQLTLDRIRREFGDTVAGYVVECTEWIGDGDEPKPEWTTRKATHVEQARQASEAAKLIMAADKLHNARSILTDLLRHGEEVWKKFRKGKKEVLAYYDAMLEALGEGWEPHHPLLLELASVLEEIKRRSPV